MNKSQSLDSNGGASEYLAVVSIPMVFTVTVPTTHRGLLFAFLPIYILKA